jgi:hypothetical protein
VREPCNFSDYSLIYRAFRGQILQFKTTHYGIENRRINFNIILDSRKSLNINFSIARS